MEQQLLDFLKFLEDEFKYSKNTIAAYKNDLTQFLHFILEQQGDGLQEWGQVSDENVQAYVAFMKQQPYASSSIARKVAAVKSFFNHLFLRARQRHEPHLEHPQSRAWHRGCR